MRTIAKRAAPSALTAWRQPRLAASRSEGMDCTYDELRRAPDVMAKVEDSLLAEQGGICAYTGHRIRITGADGMGSQDRVVEFHVEHLTAQTHCRNAVHGLYGYDTDYRNLVACWPPPNCEFEPRYGARRKGDWPSPGQEGEFVSPLQAGCSERFVFRDSGAIEATRTDDPAANETIARLNLAHKALTALRRSAILGALSPGGKRLRLRDARRLLAIMDRDAGIVDSGGQATLMVFAFAIRPSVDRYIRKVQAILDERGKS